MKAHEASSTAESMVAYRLTESIKSENERICNDPYAKFFISSHLTVLGKIYLPHKIALWLHEKILPGFYNSIIARVRFIDDYTQECINNNIQQIVLLGAGYDTRAYRLSKNDDAIQFIEVDHPATQKQKKEKLISIFGKLPTHVTFVPIDFSKESFERLLESEFNPKLKTLFIWEGVSMYLTKQDVDKTLTFIKNHSGIGSSVIFDYFSSSVPDGTCKLIEAKRIKWAVEKTGEPFKFGMGKEEMAYFLNDKGFQILKNIGSKEVKTQYFKGKNKDKYITPILSFVIAKKE